MRVAALLCIGAGLLCSAPAAAQAGHTVTIRIVDAATSQPLEGVNLELDDNARGVTTARGELSFRNVAPRAHTLTAARIGYRTLETVLRIAADTTVELRLTAAAIALDTLNVRRESLTLRGEVLGADTRRGVPDADITLDQRLTTTNGSGLFRFRDVTASEPATLTVAGPGYLPVSVAVAASRDTTVRVQLQVDPVAQRLIAQQIARLDRRSGAAPFAVRRIDRAALQRHGAATLGEALRLLGGAPTSRRAGAPTCIVIDERPWHNGPDILNSFAPEEIERVEYVSGILRIYTFSFVRRSLAAKRFLVPVVQGVCQ